MKQFFAILLLLPLALPGVPVTLAQDAELGGLPPLPDLDLGDPQRKLSWREKREMTKRANEERYEENSYTRSGDDAGRATMGQRLSAMANQSKKKPVSNQITVANSLPGGEEGITASGSRLQPFGDEDFWRDLPPPTPEESLIDLPPMPDLRTPDQITRRERIRDLRVAKFEERKAELEAKRAEKEMRERAVVNRPVADPSTALVQVESQSMGGGSFVGNQEAPSTVDQGTLKPFNEGSTYYKDSQKVYQGRKTDTKAELWWKKGTNEQGGPAEAQPKWSWRNPFFEANDDIQPVSFAHADGRGSHSASPSATSDPTPLASDLRGIRVVPTTRDVVKSPGSFSGVVTEGVELPPKVYNVLASKVGQPLTLGGLNQMVREAVLAYRKSDLPVVDVLVPEQEITSGILQLVIIEGRLGDVIVEGAGDAESRSLARQIRTARGEVIRESDLTDDLNWINKHPNRQVDLVFSPGGGYGETDIILRNQSSKDLLGYLSLENSGNEVLGEERAILGLSWTGPLFLGMDSILSYQFTTNMDGDASLFGHTGVFASYLPWRHQVTILGAYVESSANISQNGVVFDNGGENKQVSGRYGIPLPGFGRFSHEFELGMDFKSSNNGLAFNQVQVFDSTSEIVQYNLGYNIVARDNTGVWRLDSEIVNSPGDNTNKNTDAVFASQRAGATANYTYGQVTLERDQKLVEGWSAYGRIRGQASNANLLASETLGAGGWDTVRGWEERVVSGDSGLIASAELRTPVFYPSTFMGFRNVEDGAYGLIFYDYGTVSSHTPLPGEQDAELGAVGLGFRYNRDNWFSLRVDYGFQVTEEGFEDGESGRWQVGATATF
jgi:hemolysin activation/secretion protein